MTLLDVAQLQARLRQFSEDRDWNRFHTPKNLVMALAGEAGELAAVLQWVDGHEATEATAEGGGLRNELTDEMADVMIYLARLADVVDVDLNDAVGAKLLRNEQRFPSQVDPDRPETVGSGEGD
ncbi:MAG: nucleotide pyrophosphohydrolase [Acidimicrobiaceae bacterium]|nr:nucleotide pyrophosphohydrolase [Acidimicrobiaceae bacterium]